jgi:hypothetical protein
MKTKNFLIIALLFLIIALNLKVKAQDFKAGALLGASISQVDGDAMSGFNKIGAMGGLFVNRNISKNAAIQGELSYVMKGSRVASTKNTNYNQREISANYVDLSLYYKYFFDENVDVKLGLVPSVLIYHDEKTADGLSQDETALPGFRKLNCLVSIGAEYFFNEHIFVSAAFNYSLFSFRSGGADFYNYQYYHFIFEDGQYHNYFTFCLGYQL